MFLSASRQVSVETRFTVTGVGSSVKDGLGIKSLDLRQSIGHREKLLTMSSKCVKTGAGDPTGLKAT